MVRIFLLSIVFFIVQVIVVIHAGSRIDDIILDTDLRYLTFQPHQRAVIANIQNLRENNKNKTKAVYLIGGSSGREYFKTGAEIDYLSPMPIVNLCSGAQNIFDSIRLMDNINVPGSVAIYTFPPFKLMINNSNLLPSTKHLKGSSLKYPITSNALDILLKDVEPSNITTALIPSLNTVIYLAKNYIIQKKDLLLSEQFFSGEKSSGLRIFQNMFIDPIPPPTYLYVNSKPLDRKSLRDGLSKFRADRIEGMLSYNLEANLSYLDYFVGLAEEKGIKLILYELPYSQMGLSIFTEELEYYEKAMNTFLQEHPNLPLFKVEYSRYNGKEELFHDHVHLTAEGREYFHPYVEKMFNKVFSDEL